MAVIYDLQFRNVIPLIVQYIDTGNNWCNMRLASKIFHVESNKEIQIRKETFPWLSTTWIVSAHNNRTYGHNLQEENENIKRILQSEYDYVKAFIVRVWLNNLIKNILEFHKIYNSEKLISNIRWETNVELYNESVLHKTIITFRIPLLLGGEINKNDFREDHRVLFHLWKDSYNDDIAMKLDSSFFSIVVNA